MTNYLYQDDHMKFVQKKTDRIQKILATNYWISFTGLNIFLNL